MTYTTGISCKKQTSPQTPPCSRETSRCAEKKSGAVAIRDPFYKMACLDTVCINESSTAPVLDDSSHGIQELNPSHNACGRKLRSCRKTLVLTWSNDTMSLR